ncbi:MAG: glycosyltransferase family 2 protein [Halanaerobiales bacterium]
MKICTLIPAYNEEKTINKIVKTVSNIDRIDRVIVVDDGSTDNTAGEAGKAGAEVISLNENRGKGAALMKGIAGIEADILLMLDGDLIGLTADHVHKLLAPVLKNDVDMAVGIFDHGQGLTDLAQQVTPKLSGQRAIKLDILKEIQDLDDTGFGVEISINNYVKNHGDIEYVELRNLSHVMKEEKMGLWKGLLARLKMYWEILRTVVKRFTRNNGGS